MRAALGFSLQPDAEFLSLTGPLYPLVDYYEVAPETLWRAADDGSLEPNGYHARFLALAEEQRRFFVAHGVGLSLGGAGEKDARRRRAWSERIAADQRAFRFRWYSDHLGVTSPDGQNAALPLPLPMNARAARTVRRRLQRLQRLVPDVAVENAVHYFLLGEPLEEPRFLRQTLAAPRTHLVLDLHNLHTMACNFGFDPDAYLAQLDLSRVIELHISGGVDADPAWLPGARRLRLDSHDAAVPEEVWSLYARVRPRCTRLRGVTLERMEGTVGDDDVRVLREELRRARKILEKI